MKKIIVIPLVLAFVNSGYNVVAMESQQVAQDFSLLDSLPDFEVEQILEKLSYHDLGQFNRVSKRYRELAQEMLQERRIQQRNMFIQKIESIDLDLSNMNLQYIIPGVFDNPVFAQIRYLNLNNNQLTAIASHALAGLNNLRWLFLTNNQLATIAPDTFAGLNNLRMLYLSNNHLTPETRAMLQQLRQRSVRVYE